MTSPDSLTALIWPKKEEDDVCPSYTYIRKTELRGYYNSPKAFYSIALK